MLPHWTPQDVVNLRRRVARARTAKSRPLMPSAPPTDEIIQIGGMSDAEYDKLVARGEMQTWTEQDEIDLRARVDRLRGR